VFFSVSKVVYDVTLQQPSRMQVGYKSRSGRIAGYLSVTAAVCDQQLTVVGRVVYHSYGARLFIFTFVSLVIHF